MVLLLWTEIPMHFLEVTGGLQELKFQKDQKAIITASIKTFRTAKSVHFFIGRKLTAWNATSMCMCLPNMSKTPIKDILYCICYTDGAKTKQVGQTKATWAILWMD